MVGRVFQVNVTVLSLRSANKIQHGNLLTARFFAKRARTILMTENKGWNHFLNVSSISDYIYIEYREYLDVNMVKPMQCLLCFNHP